MNGTIPDVRAAFAALERRLRARRLASLEPALRVELAAIVLIVGGFLALQARSLLDSSGASRIALLLAISLALAVAGGMLVAMRYGRLARRPPGPPWGALPLPGGALERHLGWIAAHEIGWVVVPALAAHGAAIGLLAPPASVLLALLQGSLFVVAVRVGLRWGSRVHASARTDESTAPSRSSTSRGVPFVADPPWRALLRKDARVVPRRAALRDGALAVLGFALLSFLGWFLPAAEGAAAPSAFDLRHLATYFVTILFAVATAEWAVALIASDPFVPLRVLPLGLFDAWRARAAWIVGAALVLGAAHGLLAHDLAPGPRVLFVAWVTGTTFLVGLLGVHLAMTLHPRAGAARPLLLLALGVAAIASVAVFLSGWLVLAASVVWTATRLTRWSHPDGSA